MNEKLQYDINTEAAQISTLSSGKTDIYIYIYPKKRQQIIDELRLV